MLNCVLELIAQAVVLNCQEGMAFSVQYLKS